MANISKHQNFHFDALNVYFPNDKFDLILNFSNSHTVKLFKKKTY